MASGPKSLMANTKKVKVIFEEVWWVLNGIESRELESHEK